MKNSLFLFLLLVLISCKDSVRQDFRKTIEIPTEESSIVNLSQFVDSVAVIPLKMDSEAFIGQIAKIKAFDGRFYLQDNLTNSIWIFDRKGNFVDELHAVGNGPGEYIRLKDFDVDENGLHALDMPAGR